MSGDLVAFVRARLDEEQQEWQFPDMLWGETATDNDMHKRRDSRLRDIEARRAILERCTRFLNEPDQYPNGLVSPRAVLARQIVADLATSWSDHPGYQEEWALR